MREENSHLELDGIPRSTIHELRSPLTSIRGYTQLLMRGERSIAQTQRAYETVLRETDRLAGMLDQLARLAEMNTAAGAERNVQLDLSRAVEAELGQARIRWPEHVFLFERAGSVDVVAGVRRLSGLLRDLLDNAAGYSPSGSTIRTTLTARPGQACLTVQGQGIGIPDEELEKVFLLFERGSNAYQAGPAAGRGLGIGLFLARAAAESWGGRLWAENDLTRGTALHLELPGADSESVTTGPAWRPEPPESRRRPSR